jgi:hypothetical protein
MNRFDAVKHKYYIDDKPLLSVTKLISKYVRPFNSSMVAYMSAKSNKNGEDWTAEQYKDLWDLKRDIAVDYGNSIHKTIEMWIKFGVKPTQPHLEYMLDKFIEQFGHIDYQSEVRIFNEEYMLGGTVDLLSDEYLDDIKTNDTLKEVKKGNFIKPLNKLKVNNLNKVRLQTSVYDELLDKTRIKRVLMWNGEDFEVIELEPIDVQPILTERLKEIM